MKRKRTEPFSTMNEDEVEELFVDNNSPVKEKSRDSQYKRKCREPGKCEKCGREFKRIDNRNRHEKICKGRSKKPQK